MKRYLIFIMLLFSSCVYEEEPSKSEIVLTIYDPSLIGYSECYVVGFINNHAFNKRVKVIGSRVIIQYPEEINSYLLKFYTKNGDSLLVSKVFS